MALELPRCTAVGCSVRPAGPPRPGVPAASFLSLPRFAISPALALASVAAPTAAVCSRHRVSLAGRLASTGQRKRRRHRRVGKVRRSVANILETMRRFHLSDGEEIELEPNMVLGAGAQGTVYRGRVVRTAREVAIKVIPTWRWILDRDGEKKLAAIDAEYQALQLLAGHPNIVQVIGKLDIFREGMMQRAGTELPHYKVVVMEFVEGCELTEHIALNGAMSEDSARHFFVQLLDAVSHMHSHGVLHRDLKPQNVMLSGAEDALGADNRHITIIDFGTAKVLSHEGCGTVVGTAAIMPPEVVREKQRESTSRAVATWTWSQGATDETATSAEHLYDARVDVWAIGVVLYLCVSGRLPFADEAEILNSDFPREPLRGTSEELQSLLTGLLRKEQSTRLTLQAAGQHPWVTATCSHAAEARSRKCLTPVA